MQINFVNQTAVLFTMQKKGDRNTFLRHTRHLHAQLFKNNYNIN